MGTIIEGFGCYTPRPDGTREYACTTNVEINGQKLYAFDPESGLLHISASKESIETLITAYGGVPQEGKDLTLPGFFGEQAHFKGVKRVESMPGVENDQYLIACAVQEPSTTQSVPATSTKDAYTGLNTPESLPTTLASPRKGLLARVRDYVRNW